MNPQEARPIKVELHAHSREDPHDWIPHTAFQLIDRAATVGYGGLAITLHDRQLSCPELDQYARQRGLVLIRGIERTIDGRHVLLLNFGPETEAVDSFEDLRALRARQPQGLVIAPHPFYPFGSCLGRRLIVHADLFDAVELNAFYVRGGNVFNRTAVRWARAHGKPVVGTSDLHRLWQLDTTCSVVEAMPTPEGICEAIRRGRIRIISRPLSHVRALTHITSLWYRGLVVPRPPRPGWAYRLDGSSSGKGE